MTGVWRDSKFTARNGRLARGVFVPMKRKIAFLTASVTLGAVLVALSCAGQTPKAATGWPEAKRLQVPVCALPALYDKPFCQPMASLAWEDGVYVARDGLTLYTDYFETDLFSFFLAGADMQKVWMYRRGPHLPQDFSNPLGKDFPWIHSDVAMSTRKTKADPFGPWRLSELCGRYFNLGGFAAIGSPGRPGHYDYIVYTSDVKDGVKIKMMKDVGQDLAGDAQGAYLPANVDDPRYHEDNPHMERPDSAKPNHLVLLFDSDDRPGKGQHDIFYSESDDAGATWSGPFPVSSVNTALDEEQPHLFREKGQWWLYLTAVNEADHRLGIFRYRQARAGDWDSWVDRQLVVGAGTAAGVGEPTLTEDGDLSFVVVIDNAAGGTKTDRYDCDPWFMKRKR